MKILGGTLRNRTLKTPKGDKTRPTLAIVRKAVFDICQSILPGAHVLDVFAGTGAIGIEALSRGAAAATFIESDRGALKCLRENIASLNLTATILDFPALPALQHLRKKNCLFNLVYIDPPYSAGPLPILEAVLPLLAPGATLFLEQGSPLTTSIPSLALLDTRRYGSTILHHYIARN